MRKAFLLLVLIAAMVSGKAQNIVYDDNAEVRTVGSFNSIEASGTVAVYLSQGTEQGVAVSAGEKKYNSKIKTEVNNGVLIISVDGGMWNGFNWKNKYLKVYVTVTDLNRIELSGASYISIAGALKSNALLIGISGASELKGIINVEKLNITISGASVARLSGTAKDAAINASGACKIASYQLSIDNCNAEATGASDVKVTVNKELNASASGGSSIYYKGAATAHANEGAGATIKNRSSDD